LRLSWLILSYHAHAARNDRGPGGHTMFFNAVSMGVVAEYNALLDTAALSTGMLLPAGQPG
jgi:hypothetical protein